MKEMSDKKQEERRRKGESEMRDEIND